MKAKWLLKNNKLIGIALLVIGAALLIWGYDVYNSAGSQISRALNGEAPAKAYGLLISGTVCAVLGILKLK